MSRDESNDHLDLLILNLITITSSTVDDVMIVEKGEDENEEEYEFILSISKSNTSILNTIFRKKFKNKLSFRKVK